MVNIIQQKSPKEIKKGVDIFNELTEAKYETPKHSSFTLKDRTWPDKKIDRAPIWASVDLRDGNQSIEKPMTIEQKLEYFNILVNMGFKEIEIGFPSASQEDYDFTRLLIKGNYIPDNVKIGVLTQSREHLIEKTRKSLEGAKNVIVHLYNSTSEVQRVAVFKKSKKEIIELAEFGVDKIKESFEDFDGDITLEYSPESFTGTEIEFAKDICNSVLDRWGDFGGNDVIINLPSTIENSTPDVFADKVEYMVRELVDGRKSINDKVKAIISVHAHNDRGTAVTSTELALKAGAHRVEGTLLGNGERTGNVDLATVALNMYSQGIKPNLDFSNYAEYSKRISDIIQIPIHHRHPYIGKFVNLAFSGSHQDAIKKCFEFYKNVKKWINAYLPFDPKDIGLEYEPIQINSQSGKGGIAYILKENGYDLPKKIQPFIGEIIQRETDKTKGKLDNNEIVKIFEKNINNIGEIDYSDFDKNKFEGKGIIEKFSNYISDKLKINFEIKFYEQKNLEEGRGSEAISYFILENNGEQYFGIGKDADTIEANKKAIISGINNFTEKKETN